MAAARDGAGPRIGATSHSSSSRPSLYTAEPNNPERKGRRLNRDPKAGTEGTADTDNIAGAEDIAGVDNIAGVEGTAGKANRAERTKRTAPIHIH